MLSLYFAGSVSGDQVGQLAIITRTNIQLFKEAVNKCVYSESNERIAFAGVSTKYKIILFTTCILPEYFVNVCLYVTFILYVTSKLFRCFIWCLKYFWLIVFSICC